MEEKKKMTTTKREERIAELNELMQELEMTQRETLFAILSDFYEAAGFEEDAPPSGVALCRHQDGE